MIFRRRHAKPSPSEEHSAPADGMRPEDLLAMTGAAQTMATGAADYLSAARTLLERDRRNRAWIWALGIGFGVLAACSGLLVSVLVRQSAIVAELRANQAQVQAVQARTSNEVLCPLYGVFVDSFTAAARARQPMDTLVAYDQAVAVIKSAYLVLHCPLSPHSPGRLPRSRLN